MLQLAVLPQLAVALQKLLLDVIAMMPPGVTMELPIGTPTIPYNPSIANDELSLRVNVITAP